jgi:hypothetical protein
VEGIYQGHLVLLAIALADGTAPLSLPRHSPGMLVLYQGEIVTDPIALGVSVALPQQAPDNLGLLIKQYLEHLHVSRPHGGVEEVGGQYRYRKVDTFPRSIARCNAVMPMCAGASVSAP